MSQPNKLKTSDKKYQRKNVNSNQKLNVLKKRTVVQLNQDSFVSQSQSTLNLKYRRFSLILQNISTFGRQLLAYYLTVSFSILQKQYSYKSNLIHGSSNDSTIFDFVIDINFPIDYIREHKGQLNEKSKTQLSMQIFIDFTLKIDDKLEKVGIGKILNPFVQNEEDIPIYHLANPNKRIAVATYKIIDFLESVTFEQKLMQSKAQQKIKKQQRKQKQNNKQQEIQHKNYHRHQQIKPQEQNKLCEQITNQKQNKYQQQQQDQKKQKYNVQSNQVELNFNQSQKQANERKLNQSLTKHQFVQQIFDHITFKKQKTSNGKQNADDKGVGYRTAQYQQSKQQQIFINKQDNPNNFQTISEQQQYTQNQMFSGNFQSSHMQTENHKISGSMENKNQNKNQQGEESSFVTVSDHFMQQQEKKQKLMEEINSLNQRMQSDLQKQKNQNMRYTSFLNDSNTFIQSLLKSQNQSMIQQQSRNKKRIKGQDKIHQKISVNQLQKWQKQYQNQNQKIQDQQQKSNNLVRATLTQNQKKNQNKKQQQKQQQKEQYHKIRSTDFDSTQNNSKPNASKNTNCLSKFNNTILQNDSNQNIEEPSKTNSVQEEKLTVKGQQKDFIQSDTRPKQVQHQHQHQHQNLKQLKSAMSIKTNPNNINKKNQAINYLKDGSLDISIIQEQMVSPNNMQREDEADLIRTISQISDSQKIWKNQSLQLQLQHANNPKSNSKSTHSPSRPKLHPNYKAGQIGEISFNKSINYENENGAIQYRPKRKDQQSNNGKKQQKYSVPEVSNRKGQQYQSKQKKKIDDYIRIDTQSQQINRNQKDRNSNSNSNSNRNDNLNHYSFDEDVQNNSQGNNIAPNIIKTSNFNAVVIIEHSYGKKYKFVEQNMQNEGASYVYFKNLLLQIKNLQFYQSNKGKQIKKQNQIHIKTVLSLIFQEKSQTILQPQKSKQYNKLVDHLLSKTSNEQNKIMQLNLSIQNGQNRKQQLQQILDKLTNCQIKLPFSKKSLKNSTQAESDKQIFPIEQIRLQINISYLSENVKLKQTHQQKYFNSKYLGQLNLALKKFQEQGVRQNLKLFNQESQIYADLKFNVYKTSEICIQTLSQLNSNCQQSEVQNYDERKNELKIENQEYSKYKQQLIVQDQINITDSSPSKSRQKKWPYLVTKDNTQPAQQTQQTQKLKQFIKKLSLASSSPSKRVDDKTAGKIYKRQKKYIPIDQKIQSSSFIQNKNNSSREQGKHQPQKSGKKLPAKYIQNQGELLKKQELHDERQINNASSYLQEFSKQLQNISQPQPWSQILQKKKIEKKKIEDNGIKTQRIYLISNIMNTSIIPEKSAKSQSQSAITIIDKNIKIPIASIASSNIKQKNQQNNYHMTTANNTLIINKENETKALTDFVQYPIQKASPSEQPSLLQLQLKKDSIKLNRIETRQNVQVQAQEQKSSYLSFLKDQNINENEKNKQSSRLIKQNQQIIQINKYPTRYHQSTISSKTQDAGYKLHNFNRQPDDLSQLNSDEVSLIQQINQNSRQQDYSTIRQKKSKKNLQNISLKVIIQTLSIKLLNGGKQFTNGRYVRIYVQNKVNKKKLISQCIQTDVVNCNNHLFWNWNHQEFSFFGSPQTKIIFQVCESSQSGEQSLIGSHSIALVELVQVQKISMYSSTIQRGGKQVAKILFGYLVNTKRNVRNYDDYAQNNKSQFGNKSHGKIQQKHTNRLTSLKKNIKIQNNSNSKSKIKNANKKINENEDIRSSKSFNVRPRYLSNYKQKNHQPTQEVKKYKQHFDKEQKSVVLLESRVSAIKSKRNQRFFDQRNAANRSQLKKYMGGNIKIGKASRFISEQDQLKKLEGSNPGPGSYQIPSFFERHYTKEP